MNYRIETKDSFQIIAKTQRFVKIEDIVGRSDIPEFWTKCHQDGTAAYLTKVGKKDGVLGNTIVGMCLEDSTIVKDFPYSIGAEYAGGPVPEGYSLFDIPAATWAIFEMKFGCAQDVQTLIHQIFAEFFPSSEYKPAGNYDLEVYPAGSPYHSEMWIAVTKK